MRIGLHYTSPVHQAGSRKEPVSDSGPIRINEGPEYENKCYEEKMFVLLKASDPTAKLLQFLQIVYFASTEPLKQGQRMALPVCCMIHFNGGKSNIDNTIFQDIKRLSHHFKQNILLHSLLTQGVCPTKRKC